MDDAAFAAAFITRYLADRAEGRALSLADYLKLYPGHEELVAREYTELLDRPAPAGAPSIGPYELLRELGSGGQGTVHLARDRRLGRHVALKVMTRWGAASEEMVQRFRREAEVASRLDHPGICAVYDAGVSDGIPFIAMRYVEGESLARRIAKTRPAASLRSSSILDLEAVTETSVEDAEGGSPSSGLVTRKEMSALLEIVEKTARALHAAHEAGVVHRDIKPGNIMLAEGSEPVILDFGLARAAENDLATLTQTGDVFGTPAYMSPEQLLGDTRLVDRRADVWALGVTLFESVTGRRPFEAPTRQGLADAILKRDPADPRRLNRAVPRDLKIVLETALEKDRNRRYRTALDFAEDLRRVRRFEPVLARPAGAILRFRRWTQRNPTLAAALATVFVMLAGGLVLTLFLLADARRERDDKERAWKETAKERDLKSATLVRSDGLRLGSQAAIEAPENPVLASLLALEALDRVDTPSIRETLRLAMDSSRELRTLYGHRSAILGCDLSSDGSLALTGSADHTARLWDGLTGECLMICRHRGRVERVQFCADGTRFMTMTSGAEEVDDNAERDAGPVGEVAVWDAGMKRVVWQSPAGWQPHRAVLDPTGLKVALVTTEVVIWDCVQDQKLTTINELPGKAASCAFSPDGLRIAIGCEDGSLSVFDVLSGARLTRVEDLRDAVTALDFSDDGTVVMCRTGSAGVAVAECASGTVLFRQSCRSGIADLSPDGTRLVVAADGSLVTWDLRKNERRGRAEDRQKHAASASLSPDSRTVASGSVLGTVRLLDADSGDAHAVLRGHTSEVLPTVWTKDGTGLLTASTDHTARLWSFAPRREALLLKTRGFRGPHLPSPIDTLDFSPDGSRLGAIASSLRGVCVWDVRSRKGSTASMPPVASSLSLLGSLHFSGDGKQVVSFYPETRGMIDLLELDTGQRKNLGRTGLLDAKNGAARLSPDGRRLLVSWLDGSASILDPAASTELARLKGHESSMVTLAWSADGTRILTAAADGTARLWDAETGVERLRIGEVQPLPERPADPPPEVGTGTVVSPFAAFGQGDRAIVVCRGGKLSVWDSASGERRSGTEIIGESSRHLVTHPTRSVAVIVTDKKRLHLWDWEAGTGARLIATPVQDADAPTNPRRGPRARFSADGRILLAVLFDGTVRLVDTGTWREFAVFRDRDDPFVLAAITPDGEWLATASLKGEVRLHPIDIGAWARREVPRELTPEERDRFEIGAPEERLRHREEWRRRYAAGPGR